MIKVLISAARLLVGRKTLEEFKTLRAEIFAAFEFCVRVDAHTRTLPQGPTAEIAQKARETYLVQASQVIAYVGLPYYSRWLLPTPENLELARRDLLRLSNEAGKPEAAKENSYRQERVCEALKTTF